MNKKIITNNYKGTTYHLAQKPEGWMNSIQTPTGMVENGFYPDQFTADRDAMDTITVMQGGIVYNF